MTQRRVLPGQTPDAVLLDQIPGSHGPVPHELPETATLIPRDNATVDAIIHGAAYRLQPPNTSGLVRRVAHEPLLGQPPTEVRPPYPGGEARMALSFSPLPNDAGTPVFGQHVSHAFQTVRIEPVPIRYRPQHTRFDIWAQVMVREGKVVVHAPNHPRRLKPLPVEETQLRLGVISPPVYHRRIVVDPSPELRFGLPADMPIEQVRQITEYCPPVRLGGLARTIPDRRTLRGALIDWRGEQWLIVEADLGVFMEPLISPGRGRQGCWMPRHCQLRCHIRPEGCVAGSRESPTTRPSSGTWKSAKPTASSPSAPTCSAMSITWSDCCATG